TTSGLEIVTGAGEGGAPRVNVFHADGTLVCSFLAYDPAFLGGVRVAAADLDGDRAADVVTGAGPGGGPHVRAFRADRSAFASFMAYDSGFRGGVYVAAGEVTGDGNTAELVTGAGAGGGPHVKVFGGIRPGGVTEEASFFAADPSFRGGVRVGL